eukprot:scaffold9.g3082.t1
MTPLEYKQELQAKLLAAKANPASSSDHDLQCFIATHELLDAASALASKSLVPAAAAEGGPPAGPPASPPAASTPNPADDGAAARLLFLAAYERCFGSNFVLDNWESWEPLLSTSSSLMTVAGRLNPECKEARMGAAVRDWRSAGPVHTTVAEMSTMLVVALYKALWEPDDMSLPLALLALRRRAQCRMLEAGAAAAAEVQSDFFTAEFLYAALPARCVPGSRTSPEEAAALLTRADAAHARCKAVPPAPWLAALKLRRQMVRAARASIEAHVARFDTEWQHDSTLPAAAPHMVHCVATATSGLECAHCHKVFGQQLRKCSRCGKAYYCGHGLCAGLFAGGPAPACLQVEDPKRTLILYGHKTSQVVKDVLTDIHKLKGADAVKFTRKNDDVRPFEPGGEAALEAHAARSNCSLFALGSHQKKRPHNLVLGRQAGRLLLPPAALLGVPARRMFDFRLLDCVEFGVAAFRPVRDFGGAAAAAQLGNKPAFLFAGDGFDADPGLRQACAGEAGRRGVKSLLLDFFRGRVVESVNLAGLDRAILVVQHPESKHVLLRQYAIRLKKSGNRVPCTELTEMGPALDLAIRRSRQARTLTPPQGRRPRRARAALCNGHATAAKNVGTDMLEGKVGRIYMPKQDVDSIALNKMKGLKRERRAAAAVAAAAKKQRRAGSGGGEDGGE